MREIFSSENEVIEKPEEEMDSLWLAIQPEIERYFDNVYGKKFNKNSPEGLADFQERKNNAVKRERKFFADVLKEALRFYNDGVSPDDHIILFDIDDTLAKTLYGEGDNFTTAIRPSAGKTFSWLKEKMPKVKLGFITSRASLSGQLEDENGLKPIGDFFDRALLFSTKEHGKGIEMASYFSEDEKWDSLKSHPYVSPEEIKKMIEEENYENLPEVYFSIDKTKLELLKKIHENNPKTRVMVVDDNDYAKFLEYGVSLYPDAIFSVL